MQRKMKVSQPKRRNIFRFTVGQNRTGCWLVSDKLGLIGGFLSTKKPRCVLRRWRAMPVLTRFSL